MTCDTDILIVGGGLNGPTLALALAQSGFRSIVIDANSRPKREADTFDGRAYALARASQKMLAALGLWDAVAKQAQAISEIKASDGHAGRGAAPHFLHFQAAEMEEGPMGYMLEDRYLRRALIATMEANDKITHLSDSMVVDQSTDGALAEVTLADGQRLQGRILIGADGRASGVAARAGIRRQGWDYGQTALVCAVKHELPHNGIAHQFFMPSGPLAILPLPDNRCSIVWSEKTARAAQIARANDAEFLKALRPAFGDFLGEIELAGVRFSYPLKLTLAEQFIAPRLALVGDAAHGVHPIAGQGLNLGFRDIGALTEVLHEARLHGEDIASELVLERYQQWRRFDTTALALGMDTVNRLFSNDNPALRLIRDIGMGLVSATPALRRGFMRQAAGLTGDLPRLLQGEAL
ncbi:MAG: 2-octaprenyl-6-methoxyphenyl hydroxylase [Rhodobacteraceae bacterium]|jgi:2-octaprenyl-6-methoxyphenol hydroxylase|nr:2-octaprenyl-6-methoxyphenyl hydroxylase [Paracoccaceae bacterium]QPI84561.1 UbiH/UbiF/VisC/COQ6 family ubiquinone biosynthesis hydroxylase [Rhodobacterales bacterium HKCCA1288]